MYNDIKNTNDSISLKYLFRKILDWLNFLISKKIQLIVFMVVGGGIGIGYSILNKPKYSGTLTFILENTGKTKLSGYSSIAAQFGLSLGDNNGGLFLVDDNIIAFMQSRSMVAKTLLSESVINGDKKLLIDRFVEFTGMKKKWEKDPRLSIVVFHNEPQTILEDSIITEVYKEIRENYLTVSKPDKKADVIYITTKSQSEWFSKQFSETLLQNVSSFYIETQTKKTSENVAILQRQVDSVRGFLNTAISGVAISSDANPNPNPALQRLRVPSQKKLVDVEMNKAILEELVKNLELAKITLRKETPLVQVIDRPVLPLDKKYTSILKGVILGLFWGGFFGVVWVSLRRYFEKLRS